MRLTPLRLLTCYVLLAMLGLTASAPGQVGSGSSLEATLDVGEKFRDGVSLIWSPVGNAAWSDLLDFHKVEKIHMEPRSPTAEMLNAFQMDKTKVLPPGSLSFAGADSEKFREEVRTALRKHLGENAAQAVDPYVPLPVDSPRIALVACAIARHPFFPSHFAPDAEPRLFTDRLGVHHRTLGFGAKGKGTSNYQEDVRVLSDDLTGHYSLRLNFFVPENGVPEFLVLSTAGKHLSLKDAIQETRRLLAQKREPERRVDVDGVTHRYTDTLEPVDELWIPYLRASILCDYPDLVQKSYLKTQQEPTGWTLREACQFLNWKLDHEGAVIQAAAVMAPADPLGPAPEKEAAKPINLLPLYRKSFIFNKPFIATVWREGADWPYFACWIDGPDMLMVKK